MVSSPSLPFLVQLVSCLLPYIYCIPFLSFLLIVLLPLSSLVPFHVSLPYWRVIEDVLRSNIWGDIRQEINPSLGYAKYRLHCYWWHHQGAEWEIFHYNEPPRLSLLVWVSWLKPPRLSLLAWASSLEPPGLSFPAWAYSSEPPRLSLLALASPSEPPHLMISLPGWLPNVSDLGDDPLQLSGAYDSSSRDMHCWQQNNLDAFF